MFAPASGPGPSHERYAVIHDSEPRLEEGFEISPRFRRTLEERIARLERDAAWDEAQMARLEDRDHLRRQRRLVALERAEALRMRIFLDRSRTKEQGSGNRDQGSGARLSGQ